MTSEHTWLIVPDEQMLRLGYTSDLIQGNVGSEYKVNTPSRNQRKYIFGSLEYPSGEGLYEIYPHKRHEEFQSHLEHLMDMYPDDYLFVVRDNATSHVTPKLDTFLRSTKDQLCLVPLPT